MSAPCAGRASRPSLGLCIRVAEWSITREAASVAAQRLRHGREGRGTLPVAESGLTNRGPPRQKKAFMFPTVVNCSIKGFCFGRSFLLTA